MVAQLERDTCEWRRVQGCDKGGGKRSSVVAEATSQVTTKNILTVLMDGAGKSSSTVRGAEGSCHDDMDDGAGWYEGGDVQGL